MAEKQNTPEIRFEGFIDPWEQRKLGEMADRYKELVPTPRNGYVRMGVRSHAKGTFLTEVEPGQQIEEQELSKVKADNLVVNIVFAWEHAVAITSVDDAKALVSHRFPQFSFHDDMEPGFFRYAVLDEAFRWHLWLASPSGAGRNKTLNVGTMLEYEFSVPKKAEQAKIAAFFDRLDDLITLHQRKYDKLCTVKKSMLDKMFPKPGETEPEIRFEGFTDPWEQRKLGDLYRSGDEKNERLEFNIDKTISVSTMTWNPGGNGAAAESLPLFKVLRYGDLAFEGNRTKGHPYGKLVVNDIGAGIMSSRFRTLAAKQTPCVSFWKCFLLNDATFRSIYINCTKRGTLMTELVVPELLQSSVLLPTEAEQSEIGTFFTQLDSLITLHQRKCQYRGLYGYLSWEQRKLGEVATRHDNLRIPITAKDRIPGDTPYYGANGIQDYVEGYTHEGEFVLVAEDGATDLDNYPVQLISGLSWVNNHAHVIKAIPDVAQNRFIMYLIKSMDIASYLVGGTRSKLNAEVLMGIELKLPSNSEQIYIGALLSTLDSLITLHQ